MHRAASANRDHTQSKVWMTAWTMNSTIADTFGKLRFSNIETLPDSQTHSQACIKWSHLDKKKCPYKTGYLLK